MKKLENVVCKNKEYITNYSADLINNHHPNIVAPSDNLPHNPYAARIIEE